MAQSQGSLRAYDMYWKQQYLGYTLVDTTQFDVKAQVVRLEVDQVSGVAGAVLTGTPAEVKATFIDVSVDYLASKLLAGQVLDVTNGSQRAIYGGNRFIDLIAISGSLLMHPSGVDLSDQSNDIEVFLAAPDLSAFTLVGSRTKFQDIAVTFLSFPVQGAELGKEYWRLGPNISSQSPLSVMLSFQNGPTMEAPYIGTEAMTLSIGTNVRVNTYIANGTVPGSFSAKANGAYTNTATSIPFDSAISNNMFAAGNVLKTQAGEFLYVTAVAYATATTGTFTVVRGALTQNGAGIASVGATDNLFLVASFSTQNVQETATYASSAPGFVTVGNTYASGTAWASRKGVMVGIAAGASNITATFNAVTSGNMPVTV